MPKKLNKSQRESLRKELVGSDGKNVPKLARKYGLSENYLYAERKRLTDKAKNAPPPPRAEAPKAGKAPITVTGSGVTNKTAPTVLHQPPAPGTGGTLPGSPGVATVLSSKPLVDGLCFMFDVGLARMMDSELHVSDDPQPPPPVSPEERQMLAESFDVLLAQHADWWLKYAPYFGVTFGLIGVFGPRALMARAYMEHVKKTGGDLKEIPRVHAPREPSVPKTDKIEDGGPTTAKIAEEPRRPRSGHVDLRALGDKVGDRFNPEEESP